MARGFPVSVLPAGGQMPVVGPVAVVAGVDLSEAGSLFWIFGGWFCLNLSTC